jgi:hypothetical protein
MLVGVAILIPSIWAQRIQPDAIPVRNWSLPKSTDPLVANQSEMAASSCSRLVFIAITPCRVVDTRGEGGSGKTGPFGPPSLVAGQARVVPVPSSNCGVPAASAYSMNFVSVTPAGKSVAWIAAWQDDMAWPGTAILSALQGGVVGNSAIVTAGADGGIQVLTTNNGDLVIDINGYYVQATTFEGPIGPQGPAGDTGATGAPGIPGPPGPAGQTGPPGAPGSTGSQGASGPPIAFHGIWSNATVYTTGDAVFFNGSSYVSLSGPNIGNTPSSGVPWALLAQQGATGATGANGTNGTNGTNGAPGPQGNTGATGAAGPPQMFVAQFSNIPNATTFAGLNGPIANQTIGAVATIMPSACTFNALYVAGTITGNVGPDTLTFTLMKNGVATTMTASMSLSVAGTTVISTDTSDTFSVVAGDSIAIQIFQTNTGTPPVVRMSATTQCQ